MQTSKVLNWFNKQNTIKRISFLNTLINACHPIELKLHHTLISDSINQDKETFRGAATTVNKSHEDLKQRLRKRENQIKSYKITVYGEKIDDKIQNHNPQNFDDNAENHENPKNNDNLITQENAYLTDPHYKALDSQLRYEIFMSLALIEMPSKDTNTNSSINNNNDHSNHSNHSNNFYNNQNGSTTFLTNSVNGNNNTVQSTHFSSNSSQNGSQILHNNNGTTRENTPNLLNSALQSHLSSKNNNNNFDNSITSNSTNNNNNLQNKDSIHLSTTINNNNHKNLQKSITNAVKSGSVIFEFINGYLAEKLQMHRATPPSGNFNQWLHFISAVYSLDEVSEFLLLSFLIILHPIFNISQKSLIYQQYRLLEKVYGMLVKKHGQNRNHIFLGQQYQNLFNLAGMMVSQGQTSAENNFQNPDLQHKNSYLPTQGANTISKNTNLSQPNFNNNPENNNSISNNFNQNLTQLPTYNGASNFPGNSVNNEVFHYRVVFCVQILKLKFRSIKFIFTKDRK